MSETLIDIMPYIWLAFSLFMVVVEIATVQLVSIWFVVGGVAAAITSIVTDNFIIQITVFIVVTAIALFTTRPLVRKIVNSKKIKTNSDRYVGKVGLCTIEINNSKEIGQINVEGSIWTARTLDNDIMIKKDEHVKVVDLQGVKLIVTPIDKGE